MKKTLIALAVAGLMSGAAFADTSVVIGGKFDAGYQFKNTANVDVGGTYQGSTTTATLGDGAASTSRITVQAKEDLAPGWSAMVDLDLRFGTIEEGKNTTTTGGLNSNDKKALYLSSPFGSLRWGVMNLVGQQYWDFEEKPYMVNVKDLEIVKYGISEKRHESLTSRNTEYDTPILTIGNVKNRLKFNYAFGDARKSGSNDINSTGSGDVYAIAETGAVGKWVNWTLSAVHRVDTWEGTDANTASGYTARNGTTFQEHSINIHPIEGLKIGFNYNIYKGFGDSAVGDNGVASNGIYKEKNTNIVVAYNFGSKAQIGIARAHLNDLADTRNSGKSWMIGGSYFLTKSTYLYVGYEKDDFARNEKGYTKYAGTKTGEIDSWSKVDSSYTRFGIVKEF
jgi:hypothetical protein